MCRFGGIAKEQKRMRKVWSLSALLMLALVIFPGCRKKQQVEEEPATTTETPAEGCGDATAEGCGCGWEEPAEGCGCGAMPEGCGDAPAEGCGCGWEDEPAEGCGCGAAPEGCGCGAMPEGCGCGAAPEGCGCGAAPEGCGCGAMPEGCGCGAMPEGCGCGAAPEGCGCGAMPEGCGEGCGWEEEPTEPAGPDNRATATAQQTKVVKERLKALAKQRYQNLELAEARELYRRVLILDASDEEAREMFAEISRELGERVPVATDVIEREADRIEARRQQTVVAIRQRLAEADAFKADKRYDEAIRKYEEIVHILNFYRYEADFPISIEGAREMIKEAREARELHERRKAEELRKQIERDEEARREQAREGEMRRMKVFLQMASDAYDRGDYELAVANAQKVLSLDPRNESARKLVEIARETKYVAERNDIRERFNDEWRTVMEQLEYDALPHPDIIRYPSSWAEIARRKPKATGTRKTAEVDPRTEQILNTLSEQRVFELNWGGDITLAGAVRYLSSVTGLNFVMSRRVKDDNQDTVINLQLDNVSVRQVLNFMTEPNEMAWKVRNGVVMILNRDEALDQPILEFYDVKDLVAKISDFPGQEINLVPSKYQPPEPPELQEPLPAFEIDALIEVIRQTIQPESWDTIEGAMIEPKNNVLVVVTTPEIHQRVGAFLSDLRRNTGLLISLEVRFLTAEDRFLRDVGVDVRGLGNQTGGVGLPGLGGGTNFDDSFTGSTANPSGSALGVIPEPSSIGTASNPGVFFGDGADGEYKGRVENLFDFVLQFDQPGQATAAAQGSNRGANSGGFTLQHTFLDDTQFEVILRAVEKSERIEQINAPRLTVYDTQRANVSVLTQSSYVQDFDVEIAQAAAIGDPIVRTIRDGIILDVRPIVSADRRFITMELRPTVADLVRPIPTFQTSLATGPPVTIQVPEIAISRVRTTVTMPDGGTLMLGGIKFFRDVIAESGIPVLSKIPVVSFLFTRKAKTVQRRNLLILIKADVVIPEERAPTLFTAR